MSHQLPSGAGVPCPECKSSIPVSLPALVSGRPLVCPSCKLELRIDPEESRSSLEALRQLDPKKFQA